MPERINGGQALVAIGAIALIVSLFLSWYEPGRSAWTVFEVWDIVLAAIGIAALASIVPARRTDVRDEQTVPERWLPALAGAALVIVVVSIVNHPPPLVAHRRNSARWARPSCWAPCDPEPGAHLSRHHAPLGGEDFGHAAAASSGLRATRGGFRGRDSNPAAPAQQSQLTRSPR